MNPILESIQKTKQSPCPKCKKGFVSKREGEEDQFIDFDIPTLNKFGDGIWEEHSAPKLDKDGNTVWVEGKEPVYETITEKKIINGKEITVEKKKLLHRGTPEMITWKEPVLEKIFVLKSTSKVSQEFCSNALCDYNDKNYEVIKEYDIE